MTTILIAKAFEVMIDGAPIVFEIGERLVESHLADRLLAAHADKVTRLGPTDQEIAAHEERADQDADARARRNADGLRLDGPTLEEYVARGYKPENYPPRGYAEKASAGLQLYRELLMKDTVPATTRETPKPGETEPAGSDDGTRPEPPAGE